MNDYGITQEMIDKYNNNVALFAQWCKHMRLRTRSDIPNIVGYKVNCLLLDQKTWVKTEVIFGGEPAMHRLKDLSIELIAGWKSVEEKK